MLCVAVPLLMMEYVRSIVDRYVEVPVEKVVEKYREVKFVLSVHYYDGTGFFMLVFFCLDAFCHVSSNETSLLSIPQTAYLSFHSFPEIGPHRLGLHTRKHSHNNQGT